MLRPERLASLLLLAACGRVVPAGGEPRSSGALTPFATASSRALLEPRDLIPADLDLVVRLDLRMIRESLGALAADALFAKGLDEARLDRTARDVFRGLGSCGSAFACRIS
ncbi:MAG: hypothetical protein FJ095_06190 [Deltaproteobacteria bacterium]|nr:hypothetical protein [Deltaproteobacteria bacterium]